MRKAKRKHIHMRYLCFVLALCSKSYFFFIWHLIQRQCLPHHWVLNFVFVDFCLYFSFDSFFLTYYSLRFACVFYIFCFFRFLYYCVQAQCCWYRWCWCCCLYCCCRLLTVNYDFSFCFCFLLSLMPFSSFISFHRCHNRQTFSFHFEDDAQWRRWCFFFLFWLRKEWKIK